MSHLNVDFLRLMRSERVKSCFVTKVRACTMRSSKRMEFKRIFIFYFKQIINDFRALVVYIKLYQKIDRNSQIKNREIAQPEYIAIFGFTQFQMQIVLNGKNGFCQITVRLMLFNKILKKANNRLYTFPGFSQITVRLKNNAVFMEITQIIDFFMLQLRLYTIPASIYQMSLTCQGCIQLQKQAKVIEVELQFEIKKLTEDMALQKVKLQLAHQKEVKKWAERLNFNKNERQLQNKSWMEKYDAMTQLYEQKLKKTETACQLAVAKAHQQMTVEQKNTIQQSQARISKEVEQIKRESEDYKRKLLSTKEEQKKYLLKIHEQELAKQAEKHKVELAVLEEQKEELKKIISGFESAERTSKIVNVQISEQLLEKKMEIESLKEKNRTLQHRIKFKLEAEIVNKDKHILKIKAENEQACRKLANDFAAEKEKIIKEMNQKIQKMLEKEYVKCIEYQNKLKALDEQRLRQISLYQQQLQSMKITIEERLVPKSQFHEQISTLKGRLTSKEKDIQRAKEQIKQCKLQIQNNEQILTKFFKSTTNHTHTAPDIFVNTPKKKDYKIKKNRVSVSGAGGMLDVPGRFSNVTSMESLDKLTHKDFESFRIL